MLNGDLTAWRLFLPGLLLGAMLACALGAAGIMLRVREEAVAALAYAQVAVLGAMLAIVVALPPLAGAWGLAVAAALLTRRPTAGPGRHLQLLLLAWALALLVADNQPSARMLSAAAIEGQLLLLRWGDWPWFAALALGGGALLAMSGRAWLAGELLPWLPQRQTPPARIATAAREIGVVSLLAAGALAFGVLVTLALVLVPAGIAWARATNLRQAWVIAALCGLVAHLLAFVIALAADQVYSAVLVALLLACALLLRISRR